MTEPRWLTREIVAVIHREQLVQFGGADGVRDEGLLESVLAKPINKFHYEPEAGLFAFAAAYCHGIVSNHPFVDGNKRTGLLATVAFLQINGYRLNPAQADEVAVILSLASGELAEEELARWIAANSSPV